MQSAYNWHKFLINVAILDNIIEVHKKRSYEPGITLFSMTLKEIKPPCSKGFCFPGLFLLFKTNNIWKECKYPHE